MVAHMAGKHHACATQRFCASSKQESCVFGSSQVSNAYFLIFKGHHKFPQVPPCIITSSDIGSRALRSAAKLMNILERQRRHLVRQADIGEVDRVEGEAIRNGKAMEVTMWQFQHFKVFWFLELLHG